MRIAYFSPLNPIKSGISDYSEDLLKYLSEDAELDIYVNGFNPENEYIIKKFNIYDINMFKINNRKKPYDCNLYQMGNNHLAHEWIYLQALKDPGVVVLHDFALHHMLAAMTVARGKPEVYLDEMLYAHGEEGFQIAQSFVKGQAPPPWETMALEFPMNRKIIEASKGIIVHSYYTRNLVKSVAPLTPVKVISLYGNISENPSLDYQMARKDLGIEPDVKIIATFGFVTPAKRLDKILNVLARLYSEGYKFKFCIVGEVPNQEEMERHIYQLNLPPEVIEFTGHIELSKFFKYMKASDICINLRYPVHGETSATLHHLLGLGKPVLVSNAGSFREYPDDIVIKIDVNNKEELEIYESLKELIENSQVGLDIGKKSYSYAEQTLDIRKIAQAYIQFITGIINGNHMLESLVISISKILVDLEFDQKDQLIEDCAKCFPSL